MYFHKTVKCKFLNFFLQHIDEYCNRCNSPRQHDNLYMKMRVKGVTLWVKMTKEIHFVTIFATVTKNIFENLLTDIYVFDCKQNKKNVIWLMMNFHIFLITKIASICTISKDNVIQVKHTNLLKDVLSNQRKILLLNTNHSCVFVLTRGSLAKFSQCNSSQLYSRIKRTIHPYSFEGHSREAPEPVAETRRRILRVF